MNLGGELYHSKTFVPPSYCEYLPLKTLEPVILLVGGLTAHSYCEYDE